MCDKFDPDFPSG